MRYQFIEEHKTQFPVVRMCRVLEVSAAGYYAWQVRRPSPTAQANEQLSARIQAVFKTSRQTYGSPRVCQQLRQEGQRCSEKRVARLMQQADLVARCKRRYKVTTDSNHDLPIAANLLNRQFSVTAPQRAWAGDITYIPTAQGWLYLAVVLDLGSRRVVGWALENSIDTEIVLKAVKMALGNRIGQTAPAAPAAAAKSAFNLLFHSDRGSQYASAAFRDCLHQHGLQPSMSRRGNCWDNAPVESFFSTLKTELIGDHCFTTRDQARLEIFEYIEVFYNRQRLHSSLNYLSPVDYERRQQLCDRPVNWHTAA